MCIYENTHKYNYRQDAIIILMKKLILLTKTNKTRKMSDWLINFIPKGETSYSQSHWPWYVHPTNLLIPAVYFWLSVPLGRINNYDVFH